jgi:hypothetical protein
VKPNFPAAFVRNRTAPRLVLFILAKWQTVRAKWQTVTQSLNVC